MRYTPNGTAVTSFTVLTSRGWKDDDGNNQSSPEYSNVVVWSKLAEICNQLLIAGSKVFIEGRLQTRSWEDQEGVKHYKTEIIADDMVLLGGRAGTVDPISESEIAIEPDECMNKVQVIGNLARDPELRYLPSGTPVITFAVATNRSWTNSDGVRQESTEFHNIVAWNELAESISKSITKGQKVFIEGRLQNRSWEGDDGVKRYKTEVVVSFLVGSIVREEMESSGTTPSAPKPSPSEDDTSTASDDEETVESDESDNDEKVEEPPAEDSAAEESEEESPADESETPSSDVAEDDDIPF
jgi:single-strand DNA-binding protein